jgi:hypothetical protein
MQANEKFVSQLVIAGRIPNAFGSNALEVMFETDHGVKLHLAAASLRQARKTNREVLMISTVMPASQLRRSATSVC